MPTDALREFIQCLPLPALVAKHTKHSRVNHPTLLVNQQFSNELGYVHSDIPDKHSWWQKVYPDPLYQQVVQRQWELEEELAEREGRQFIRLDVNLTFKNGREKRYRVLSSPCPGLPDYIQVLFIELTP